ncbi:secreted frizzled-related protein 1 isoform X2 [Mauremys reevesii]|uniref:secreted frizzled-related protein 1 isoform X2 n=1 Tax=Mauremys reevesii TaxID=260615 RepID=UPI00193EE111|nr:secreted frizzled-related protein 1 isoform X2 [Mauremys reevesii]
MGRVQSPGGPSWSRAGALLALAARLFACSHANEYDYVSFQSDIGSYQSGRFYTKPPQCVAIPADLRLCHSVGYDKMVLPNLLDHETMAEVKQQASSWVPLLNKNCHIGTQVFLCSLFAPVCLDRPIYPCRWLCEAVRDSCEPVMQFFGFYWPEMLKCDQFPQDDVCIAMTTPNATEASKPQGTAVCPPCDNEMKSDAIIEHLCASEFASKDPYQGSRPHCDKPGTSERLSALPCRRQLTMSLYKDNISVVQLHPALTNTFKVEIVQSGTSIRAPAQPCLSSRHCTLSDAFPQTTC